jgi:hypothetical protein
MSRLKDLTRDLHGHFILTVEMDGDPRQMWDELHDADVDVTIKKHRNKRSLTANAYSWVMIDKIAEAMNLDKTEVYRNAIRSIGGVSEIICVRDKALADLRAGWEHNGIGWQTETMPSKIDGCTNVILYYGSSTYDTKQMSALIDHLVQDAKDLGIETLPPAELERMKVQWNAKTIHHAV